MPRISATGIIGGGSAAWTSAHTNGRYKQYDWVSIQPDSKNKNITGAAATDIITSTAHGFQNTDQVTILTLTGGAGLSVGGTYYVRDRTTDTFKLAATSGGPAIDFTTDITTPSSVVGYDWTDIDSQLASATANNKKFILLLNLNSGDPSRGLAGLPAWLNNLGATPISLLNPNHSAYLYQYISWDAVFKTWALNVIARLCDRYDGQIHQISMGGLGGATEMHMPDTYPYTTGGGPFDYVTGDNVAAPLWVAVVNDLIAQYAAHLTQTTFTAALAIPFATGTYGPDSLNSVVNTSLSLYGSRIGFENWGLNALSSTSYLPNSIIYNHRLINSVGFQMAGSTGGGGAPLHGTLRQAMEAGVALGAQYLMVYGSDIVIDTLWPDLDAVAAELLPAPPFGGHPADIHLR